MHNNLKGNHPFSYQGPHFTAYYFLSFSGSKVHLFQEQSEHSVDSLFTIHYILKGNIEGYLLLETLTL